MKYNTCQYYAISGSQIGLTVSRNLNTVRWKKVKR